MSGWALKLGLGLVAALVLGLGIRGALGIHRLRLPAGALPMPETGFPHEAFDGPLRYVRGAGFDHAGLAADRAGLDAFVATLAAVGPGTDPARFPTDDDQLAYWINAYNALMLYTVAEEGPVASVMDIHGVIEPKPGFGVFFGVRVPVDGRWMHLYGLENDVIRGFGDARIHAAINCASGSCPALAPTPYLPATLQQQLDAATRRFCAAPHVAVDHGAKQVRLSSIFEWFGGDFEAHAARLGGPADVLGFIQAFAAPALADDLQRARAGDYDRVFVDYDWTLNSPTPEAAE